MKHLIKSILSCIVLLFSGCKTLTSPELLQFVASRASEAASYAVAADLRSNPENRNIYFAAVFAMDGMLQSTNYNSAKFKDALSKLPIFAEGSDALGQYGGLALGAVVTVFDLGTMFGYKVETDSAVKIIMTAVLDGINSGLAIQGTEAMAGIKSVKVKKAPAQKLVAKKLIRI